MPERIEGGDGLKAIEGLEWITYKDLARATGLKPTTLYRYNRDRPGKPRLIPEPDADGRLWRADRQDIRDWIEGKGRPGVGARTDLYPPENQ